MLLGSKKHGAIMPKPRKKSVLIDTSFLITLFDDSRVNHENAKKY